MCVAGDAVWARDPVPMAACRLWVACGPVCRPAEPAQLSVTSGPCSSWREGLAQGAWRGGRETWSQQASPPATTEEGRGCCQALHQPQCPRQQGTSVVPATPQVLSDILQGTRDKPCR